MSHVSTGVDFSADPKGTAAAVVEWLPDRAVLIDVVRPVDDQTLRRLLNDADGPVGIDCPLGWPQTFVEFLRAHENGDLRADPNRADGWRRPLVNRRTDLFVKELTGQTPLSVAADRIAQAALRLAALTSALDAGVDARRDGSGAVVEVYPAAALRVWGLRHAGYKTREHVASLGQLVADFSSAAPWFDFGDHRDMCESSDDIFDAVICAFVAQAAKNRATALPSRTEDAAAALREGWIHVPKDRLPSRPWARD